MEKIKRDSAEIKVTMNKKRPETPTKIRSFYEVKKGEESFTELSERMVTAPVLSFWRYQVDLVVYSDASHKGVGCVLMQHNKVIVYAPRQPKPYEQKYPTNNWD